MNMIPIIDPSQQVFSGAIMNTHHHGPESIFKGEKWMSKVMSTGLFCICSIICRLEYHYNLHASISKITP